MSLSERFAGITLVGLLAYGLEVTYLWSFYETLGVSPHEVGVGYELTMTRAFAFLASLIAAFVLLYAIATMLGVICVAPLMTVIWVVRWITAGLVWLVRIAWGGPLCRPRSMRLVERGQHRWSTWLHRPHEPLTLNGFAVLTLAAVIVAPFLLGGMDASNVQNGSRIFVAGFVLPKYPESVCVVKVGDKIDCSRPALLLGTAAGVYVLLVPDSQHEPPARMDPKTVPTFCGVVRVPVDGYELVRSREVQGETDFSCKKK